VAVAAAWWATTSRRRDAKHHLIVAHEVTNVGKDRSQLYNMAHEAKEALDVDKLEVVADRGYYHGDEIRACEQNGIDAYLPKPRTSPNRAKRQFDRAAFISVEQDDEYACPAGERLIYRFTRTEAAKEIWRYWTSACTHGAIKAQ
jgi:hypothetical protein